MIKHKYIEHLQELENIRRDTSMPQPILDKVDELQLLLTEQLYRLVNRRRDDEIDDSTSEDGTNA